MIEYSNLAYAQARRVQKSTIEVQALDALTQSGWPRFDATTPIGLGAIIEAMGEDDAGSYCRTFVMLPAGAGEELTGPDGDGLITVLTPSSPVGKAMLGKRAGDVAEVTIRGEPLDWENPRSMLLARISHQSTLSRRWSRHSGHLRDVLKTPCATQRFRLMHVINRYARESGYPESFDFARVTGSPRARG